MKNRKLKVNKTTIPSAEYIADLLISGAKVTVYLSDKKEH